MLGGLAIAAFAQGDFTLARKYTKEGFTFFLKAGDHDGIARTIGIFAVHMAAKDYTRAARLFGAAEAASADAALLWLGLERAEYDQTVATVRTQLGEDAFAAAWASGRALTIEQAVAYALEEA